MKLSVGINNELEWFVGRRCCCCCYVFDINSTGPIEEQMKSAREAKANVWNICRPLAKRQRHRKRQWGTSVPNSIKCSFFRLTIWNWFANFRNLINCFWNVPNMVFIWYCLYLLRSLVLYRCVSVFFIYAKSCLKSICLLSLSFGPRSSVLSLPISSIIRIALCYWGSLQDVVLHCNNQTEERGKNRDTICLRCIQTVYGIQ